MKLIKIIFLIIFNLISNHATTQWHDLNWVLGYGQPFMSVRPFPDPNQGIQVLNFQNSKFDSSLYFVNSTAWMSFTTNCISDKNGKLLFYTDGCTIFNQKHEVVKNGDTINPGVLWERFVGHGYPIDFGSNIFTKTKFRSRILSFS
jgi:hypothetical protein